MSVGYRAAELSGPDQELSTIALLRDQIVEARSDLRFAKDDLEVRRRRVERRVITGLKTTDPKATDKDKTRAIDWALDDDQAYRGQLAVVRGLERDVDKCEAWLTRALAPLQREQWLIRQRLADAIMSYSTRPCMGVQEHAAIDTAFDVTGEHGVHLGDSRYVNELVEDVA